MTAVPRLYETMHQRIRLGSPARARAETAAVRAGRRDRPQAPRRRALSLGERLLDPVLDQLVRDKVRARFGGRLKAMVSGGAPLNPEIGGFFLALGRARCCRATARPRRRRSSAATRRAASGSTRSARRSTGVEVRIAEDGEILVARRQCHEGLLERSRGDRAHPGRRLAAHRRHRPARRRRLSAHHRPQARLHQEFGRRHDLAGAGRGRADPGAGDRPGDGVRRPPALSRRGHRPRPGVRRRLCQGARRAGDLAALAARSRLPQGARRRRRPGQPATSRRPSGSAAS